MKTKSITKAVVGLAVLGVSGWMLTAQDSGPGTPIDQVATEGPGGPPGPRHHRPPPPPLIGALDANHDGVIDETEIANASTALRTLDKNGDGKLTMDELRPPPLPRGEGRGFPPRPPGPPPEGPNGEQGPANNR